MTPSTLAAARVTIGAGVLLPLAKRAPSSARCAAGSAGVGEQHVSSSLAAILIATSPLFVALLALLFDAIERLSRRRLAGVTIGLAGVVALVGIDIEPPSRNTTTT
jgi:drug/metabolite transporter (DMT)-like permease